MISTIDNTIVNQCTKKIHINNGRVAKVTSLNCYLPDQDRDDLQATLQSAHGHSQLPGEAGWSSYGCTDWDHIILYSVAFSMNLSDHT